jgi:glycosyltransferase involved in cell wall biosynthesis
VRVLHLIKGLGPGGAERLVTWLCDARATGTECEVAYLLPAKSHLVEGLEAAGVPVHLIGSPAGLRDPRWVARLVRLVRSRRPDVVHVHSPAVAAVARVALRALPGRPVLVSTEHNVWTSFTRFTRAANAATIALGDAHLAVSREVRASMSPAAQQRTTVVLHGIPLRSVAAARAGRSSARAELGMGDDILVMTVANFREKKDYPTLLEAARQCPEHLRFVAIGQGPLEAAMHARRDELGLGERFRFLGYHPEPLRLLAAADLFVLASRYEGLPIALLEAMAVGVPPVATAVGGIPEVVTDGVDGRLVPPGRPAELARALQELAASPEARTALGRAAAQRAGDFDVARTQRTLEELYASLLAARRPSGR